MLKNLDFLKKPFMVNHDIFALLGHSSMSGSERFAALRDNLVIRQPIYMVDPKTLGVKKFYYGGCVNGSFLLSPNLDFVGVNDKALSLLNDTIKFDDLHEMLLLCFHGKCFDFTKMVYLDRQVAEREIKISLTNVRSIYNDNSFSSKITGMRHGDILISYLAAYGIKFELSHDNPAYDKRVLIGNEDSPYIVIDAVGGRDKPYTVYLEAENTELVPMLETYNLESVVVAVEVLSKEQDVVITES